MSILDIIDKDKLKEILTEDNFEIIKKIYNRRVYLYYLHFNGF